MRWFLALAITAMFAGSAASGAETSRGEILGFSQDGNTFFFREIGIADGIGAPYGSLYAIDVARDRWLPGFPVRIPASEENGIELQAGEDWAQVEQAALSKLRQQLRQQAGGKLDAAGPLILGSVRAHNPPTEFSVPSNHVRFSFRDWKRTYAARPGSQVWRLELKEQRYPPAESCASLYQDQAGFTLTLTDEASGASTVLAQDSRVPTSRRCPQTYRIETVVTAPRADRKTALVVLLRYAKPGFEGPDGRLLAVTAVVETPR